MLQTFSFKWEGKKAHRPNTHLKLLLSLDRHLQQLIVIFYDAVASSTATHNRLQHLTPPKSLSHVSKIDAGAVCCLAESAKGGGRHQTTFDRALIKASSALRHPTTLLTLLPYQRCSNLAIRPSGCAPHHQALQHTPTHCKCSNAPLQHSIAVPHDKLGLGWAAFCTVARGNYNSPTFYLLQQSARLPARYYVWYPCRLKVVKVFTGQLTCPSLSIALSPRYIPIRT